MYIGLLHLHNALRWIIVLSAIIILVKYFIGWFSQKSWKKSDNIMGTVFTSVIDLQFLTGLILYAFVSPITQAAFQDFGAAMKNADLRFYAVEHAFLMFIAVGLVHIGRARTKRKSGSKSKFAASLLFFGIAYIIILAAIPWQRVIG